MGWVWSLFSSWLWVFSLSCPPKIIFFSEALQLFPLLFFTWHLLAWSWWYRDALGAFSGVLIKPQAWADANNLDREVWPAEVFLPLLQTKCWTKHAFLSHSSSRRFFSCSLLLLELWFPPGPSYYSFLLPLFLQIIFVFMGDRGGV